MVPPARGAIAAIARAPLVSRWLGQRLPKVAVMLDGATEVTGYLDLDSAGLEAEVAVKYVSERDARSATEACRRLQTALVRDDGLVGRLSKQLHAEAVADSLVLRLKLSDEELAGELRCATGRGCEDRPQRERSPDGPAGPPVNRQPVNPQPGTSNGPLPPRKPR